MERTGVQICFVWMHRFRRLIQGFSFFWSSYDDRDRDNIVQRRRRERQAEEEEDDDEELRAIANVAAYGRSSPWGEMGARAGEIRRNPSPIMLGGVMESQQHETKEARQR